MFACEYCDQKFVRGDNLNRHLDYCEKRVGAALKLWKCTRCEKMFSRKDILTRHMKTCPAYKRRSDSEHDSAPTKKRRCETCDEDIEHQHTHLRSAKHKKNTFEAIDEYTHLLHSAYKSRVATYRVFATKDILTPEEFLSSVKERVIKLITAKQVEVGGDVKVNLELFARYMKWAKMEGGEQREMEEIKSFNTRNKVLQGNSELESIYDSFAEVINTKADEFQERDSGWALREILHLEVNINKYTPFRGSSYLPLPKWVQTKRACVNIKNEDNACFAWAVVSALHQADKHSERTSSYPHYCDVLNLGEISFPISLREIKRFETLNNISINVFEISGKVIAGPIYHTKKRQRIHINLLLIEDGDRAHYCWIKNLSRLIASQLSGHNHHMWICDGCLLSFSSKTKFKEHVKRDCAQIKTILPPPEDNILKFKNLKNRMRAPVVVYADFSHQRLPAP